MTSIHPLRNTVKLSGHDIEALGHHKCKSSVEWSSACPQCGGKDRFLFWPDKGNFWCRQCDLAGFVGQKTQSDLTDEDRAEMERRQRLAKQAEIDRKRTAVQTLRAKRNDLAYQRNLNGQSTHVKERWGLTQDSIEIFKIGYCNACPTSPQSDSFTIPYFWQSNLINLRHRLIKPNGQGKYRPEAAGLPTAIFNADILHDGEWVVMVEGEFKAMVLQQNGLPTIAIPGATIFKEKWLRLFTKGQTVYVALDPGAEAHAYKIGKMLSGAGVKARLISCPTKPDDFFTLYGGNTDLFCRYLKNGRAM